MAKDSQLNASVPITSGTLNISKKSKIRYLLARNENYEKQIDELLQSLSTYARRTAKLRDAGDNVAEKLNSISVSEVLNPTSKKTIGELSKTFRVIQDHRDSEILFLEDKLLPLIQNYGETLQKQKDELRSSSNKIFENNGRLGWIRSSSSSSNGFNQQLKRRSQSMERLDRPQNKEEKQFQQLIQLYELKKNSTLKKLLLKLILTELHFTVKSFNNLTYIYKHIMDEMNPTKDLKFFNDFLRFRPIKKSQLKKIQLDNLNNFISDNDDEDDDEDDEDNEEEEEEEDDDNSGDDKQANDLDANNNNKKKNQITDSEDDEEDDDEEEKLTPPKSATLKRFNSTPEMFISKKNDHSIENGILKQKETTINKQQQQEDSSSINLSSNLKKKINLFGSSTNNNRKLKSNINNNTKNKSQKTNKKKKETEINGKDKDDDDDSDDSTESNDETETSQSDSDETDDEIGNAKQKRKPQQQQPQRTGSAKSTSRTRK